MTPQQLAQQIALSPRAVVLVGALAERTKTSSAGMISGFSPHYTTTGCPAVGFDDQGEIMPTDANGAAIEAAFTEQPQDEAVSKILLGYGRALNMIHLQMGRAGLSPNGAEARVLREAGEIFKRHTGKAVLLAVLPVCSSAPYGVAQARLCPLGLFSLDGQPIWLHPIAVGSLLKAEYPPTQTQRSLVPKPAAPAVTAAPAAVPEPHWYERVMEVWKAKKPKALPGELHELIVERRADRLVDDGEVKTKAEGIARARKEAAEYRATQQPPAAPLRTSTGPAEPSAAKTASAPRLTAARIKP